MRNNIIHTQPLFIPVIIFIIGIILSHYTSNSYYLIPVALLCAAVALWLWEFKYSSICLIALVVGWGAESISTTSPTKEVMPNTSVSFTNGVITQVYTGNNYNRIIIMTYDPLKSHCSFRLLENDSLPAVGDIVSFKATLYPIDYNTQDVAERLPLYYYRNDIHYTGYIHDCTLHKIGESYNLKSRMSRLQQALIDKLLDSNLDETTASFIIATLLGDDSYILAETRNRYSVAGIAHMLALSGMHVAILSAIFGFVLLPFMLIGRRWIGWTILLVSLWFYVLLTGMSPSVTRSVVMISAVIFARLFNTKYSSFTALLIAAVVILIITPQDLFMPGFQLSFMAMVSLVIIPHIVSLPRHPNFFIRWSINYILFTLAAVMGTLLLAAYYFHVIPLLFLITNLPCALLFPLLLGGGVLVIICVYLGVDSSWIGLCLNYLYKLLDTITEYTVDMSYASITDVYYPLWGVIIGYIALSMGVMAYYFRSFKMAIISILCMVISILSVMFNRDTKSETIIVNNTETTAIVNLEPERKSWIYINHDGATANNERKYILDLIHDDIHRKRIDSLEIITNSTGVDAKFLTTRGRNILIAGNIPTEVNVDKPLNGIVLTSSYNGDINALCNHLKCDTIILTKNIQTRRKTKYAKQLTDSGRHVVQLSRSIESLDNILKPYVK